MKRFALVAALAILPACTAFHPDRRTATNWSLELIRDTGRTAPKQPCDRHDWDGMVNPIINYGLLEPVECFVIFPGSVLLDTLVLNPINGWQKAELQVYNRRFGGDDSRGASESGLREGQVAPGVAPWAAGDLVAAPEFVAHWLWNSLYWTDPVNKESWNSYWNQHHEASSQ